MYGICFSTDDLRVIAKQSIQSVRRRMRCIVIH